MPGRRELPTKVCPVCERPFAWRKKWERCWDEVRYCSDRCRRVAKGAHRQEDRRRGADE
ncbi:MAG: DUF2256 domain-containing protein [Planctomycetota bacterium]